MRRAVGGWLLAVASFLAGVTLAFAARGDDRLLAVVVVGAAIAILAGFGLAGYQVDSTPGVRIVAPARVDITSDRASASRE
jgi:hypothetical protein